jgi:hypothetical protein
MTDIQIIKLSLPVKNHNTFKLSYNKPFPKPEDCPICLEILGNEKPLACGHWVHIECLRKHFKPECPMCRKKLDIKVEGKFGDYREREYSREDSREDSREYEEESYYENEQLNSEQFSLDNEFEIFGDNFPQNWRWRCRGYNYEEEDPDYDEENPRGDDWYYDNEE